MLESYILFENIQQAKKFFKENNIDIENNVEKKAIFDNIKKLLGNNLNYLGLFTKFYFGKEKVSLIKGDTDKYYDSLTGLFDLIKTQKNLRDFLPKDIVKYDTFEELSDDITKAQDDIIVSNFYKNIYSSLRNTINIKEEKTKETILSFVRLPEETKKSMTPMADYKNKSGKEYINDLSNFVEKLNNSKEATEESIKSYGDKVETVYDKNNILVIRTFDKKAIKEFGSDRWCIVYSQDSYYGSYCNPMQNMTQYIIFDFNKPSTDNKSLFGVSVNDSGTAGYGASQDKANNGVNFHDLIKDLKLPPDVLVSHDYDKEVIKRDVDPNEIIKTGKARDYFTQDEINNMDIDDMTLFKYKLFSDDAYSKLSWDEKFRYNDIRLSDEEKEEIRKLSYEDKRKDVSMRVINTYKLLSPEEYQKINWVEKYKYNGGSYSEEDKKQFMELPYERKRLMVSFDIIKDERLLKDEEYDKLSWADKYQYNNQTFTETDREKIKTIPFSEKLKIQSFLNEVLTPDEDDMKLDNDLELFIESDEIVLKSTHEPYDIMEITGLEESEFYEFVDDDGYTDMYGEDDYIGNRLPENILEKIQTLMDLFGFEYEGKITDDSVIKDFYDEYKEFMVFESKHNYNSDKLSSLDLDDIVSEVGSAIDDTYNTFVHTVNKILPYKFDSKTINLYQDYIIDLLDDNEINNINELIDSVDSVEDIINKHNAKPDNKDKIDTNNFSRHHVEPNAGTMETISEKLDSVIEYTKENTLKGDFKKNINILDKLGFDGTNVVTKGDISIVILKKYFKDSKVDIQRTNIQTGKSEKGKVNIVNLNDYFSRTLFEKNIITDFNLFHI